MTIKSFARALISTGTACAVIALSTAAQAALVSYDFTANVFSSPLSGSLPANGSQITGSFSYDSEEGWWGGSNNYADPSLSFTIDQAPAFTSTYTGFSVEYNQGTFSLTETGYGPLTAATLSLSGQSYGNLGSTGALPTTLSLGNGATGLLSLFVIGGGVIKAALTSLTAAGSGTATPELDPASGGAAIVLLLGGAALVAGDRRRRIVAQVA